MSQFRVDFFCIESFSVKLDAVQSTGHSFAFEEMNDKWH